MELWAQPDRSDFVGMECAHGWIVALSVLLSSACGESHMPEAAEAALPCADDSTCCSDDLLSEDARIDAQIWFSDAAPESLKPLVADCYPNCGRRDPINWVAVTGGAFWYVLMMAYEYDGEIELFNAYLDTVLYADVNDFSMTQTEATVAQFRSVMGFDPSVLPYVTVSDEELDSLPVDCITALEAGLYCQGIGGRICTYPEWMRALLDSDQYPLKYPYEITELDSVAWYAENSGGGKHPVGQKAPNEQGLHDLLGNLAELTDVGPAGGSYTSSRLFVAVYPQQTDGLCWRGGFDSGGWYGWYQTGIRCCK